MRKENRRALSPLLEAKLKTRTTAEWVAALNARDVPSGAILGLEAALGQAQVQHRGTLGSVEAPGIGALRLFGMTALFEKTPGSITAPPPRLSEHTAEVLARIGYGTEEVTDMRTRGIV